MKTATRLAALVALAAGLLGPAARAQDCATAPVVTVRQLNALPQANIDQLMAGGQSLTPEQIRTLVTPPMNGQLVRITAVLLTDPYNSGLATPTGGVPGRVHAFVRDTAAWSQGVAGMGIQIVDGRGAAAEITQFFPGDVIDVCGTVSPFIGTGTSPSVAMQLAPTSITLVASEPPVPPGDPIRQPVLITIDDIHQLLPNGTTQIRWTTYPDFNGQYVRIENAQIIQGVAGQRPDVLFQNVGQQTQLNQYDTSLRFRNDRCDEPAPANCYTNPPWHTRPEDDPFVPPPTGMVNVQGFLTFQGDDGNFNYATPDAANFVISPMEDSDFQLVTGPPVVGTPSQPTAIPGNGPVTITVTATPGDPGRTLTSVVLNYTVSTGGSGAVTMTSAGGDQYTGQIPAAPDGAFVTYSVTATDNTGASTTSASATYRVLFGGITDIEHLQRTSNGQPGNSPFVGYNGAMNVAAVVQTVFTADNGTVYAILQDDPALGEWSGIWVNLGTSTMTAGQQITITNAEVIEDFNVTMLRNLTFSVTGTGAPYAHKVLPTGVLNGGDAGFQEAHEGMLLRFEDVIITDVNADGPDTEPGFGEWQFSSDGTEPNEVRADDLSDQIPTGFNTANLAVGQGREFIQGAWYYSFGNYKLIPVALADVGMVTANEPVGPATPGVFGIAGTFPNPTTGAARVRYSVGTAGAVRLAVYDALGREVAVLADGPLAASTYEAGLDAARLAPGVYVVRLTAGGEVHTARLTVAR